MDSQDEMEECDQRLQWTEKDSEKQYEAYQQFDRRLQRLFKHLDETDCDYGDYAEVTNELHDQLMEPCYKLEELAKELLAKEKELEVLNGERQK